MLSPNSLSARSRFGASKKANLAVLWLDEFQANDWGAFHVSEKSLVAWSKLRNKVMSRAGYGIIVDIHILGIRGTYFAD
jgi:hypothetical protein